MTTRLTYTSGGLGTETDEEFESRLAEARSAAGGDPLAHVVASQPIAALRALWVAYRPWSDDFRTRALDPDRALGAPQGDDDG